MTRKRELYELAAQEKLARLAQSALTRCRNEALEEAARVAEETTKFLSCTKNGHGIASAIRARRALKTFPPKADEPQPATTPETNED